MPEDQMRYDLLAQDALRGVVRLALKRVEREGLPGEHHFFIAFGTRQPGVRLSDRLNKKYPSEMTIVLQHQFWNLAVHDDHFEVQLSFDNIPEKLVVPFSAVKGFFDPSVQFGLQFEMAEAGDDADDTGDDATAAESAEKAAGETEDERPTSTGDHVADEASNDDTKVVSLDSFRKK